MSVATGFSYDYVYNLASMLSPEEQTRLVRELPKSTSAKPEGKSESFLPEPDDTPYSAEEFYEFLLQGPVIDEEHIELMLAAREEVNRCRPISW